MISAIVASIAASFLAKVDIASESMVVLNLGTPKGLLCVSSPLYRSIATGNLEIVPGTVPERGDEEGPHSGHDRCCIAPGQCYAENKKWVEKFV